MAKGTSLGKIEDNSGRCSSLYRHDIKLLAVLARSHAGFAFGLDARYFFVSVPEYTMPTTVMIDCSRGDFRIEWRQGNRITKTNLLTLFTNSK